jgi:universal stress protein E
MPSSVHAVLVGVATLRSPDPVLPAAAALAARTGASLHVVHAFDAAAHRLEPLPAGQDPVRLLAEGLRSRLEAQVRALPSRGPVSCEVLRGAPHRVLAAAAERVGADVVVVGSTRRGPLARTVLGTTAQHMLQHARLPVLILHPELRPHLERVLLTTDLSGLSEGVHEAAMDLLEGTFAADAPVVRSLLVAWSDRLIPQEFRDGGAAAAPAALERFLRGRRSRACAVEPRVRVGEPAREIAAEAAEWDPDLVVLGTHGRTGVARVLLGSVAGEVLRGARCSVLVVPAAAVAERAADPPAGREVVEVGGPL